MKAERPTTIHDLVWPVYMFSKLVGYSPQTFQRSNRIYTASGVIIVIVMLVVKGTLIWINIDSSKFSSITNSSILNYGIWLQTETSLLLSMFLILMGLKRYEYKWILLESFNEIDTDLENIFYLKMFHREAKRCMLTVMCYGGILLLVLVAVTVYILSDLPLDNTTRYCTALSILLSNTCIFATSNQLMTSEMFILGRYKMINNILHQLIFDSPETQERNEIIGDDASCVKELSYTKYQNNFASENVFLRDQLDIKTISKNITRKKEDLKRQKENMKKPEKIRLPFIPMIASKKSQVNQYERNFVGLDVLIVRRYITKYTFQKDSTTDEIIQKLNAIYILHDKLNDCVDNLNDMCSLEMQLITSSIFVYVVFGLFARYCVWMNYQREAANIATMNICWMFLYVHSLIFNIFAGTVLVDKAKETSFLIHRIMARNSDTQLLEKLIQISEMLYSRQPILGCGLIVWDWKYLFSNFRRNVVRQLPTFVLILHTLKYIFSEDLKLLLDNNMLSDKAFKLIGGVCIYLIILIQFYVSAN